MPPLKRARRAALSRWSTQVAAGIRGRLKKESQSPPPENLPDLIWMDGAMVELPPLNEDVFAQLKWDKKADLLADGRTLYRGTSERTIRRKAAMKKAAQESSKNESKITNYFHKAGTNEDQKLRAVLKAVNEAEEKENEELLRNLQQEARERDRKKIADSVSSLNDLLFTGKSASSPANLMRPIEIRRLHSIHLYLKALQSGEKKEDAAKKISVALWNNSKSYYPKVIPLWTKSYLRDGFLPISDQGKHAKSESLLDDPDIKFAACNWLRNCPRTQRKVANLKTHLEQVIFVHRFGPGNSSTVSESTVLKYMHLWGFEYKPDTKEMYVDGHERDDVVEYRKDWSKRMVNYRKRMTEWEGEEMEIPLEPESLEVQYGREKELVMVTHDECTFYANDDKSTNWKAKGESYIKKKGPGLSVMVSDFLCACHGPLKITKEQGTELNIAEKDQQARNLLKAGRGREGYWESADMIEAVAKAIRIFNLVHPNQQGVFIFDQSTNHNAYGNDALLVNRMVWKEKPESECKYKFKSTTFEKDGVLMNQNMFYLKNGVSYFKGIKMVS